MQVAKTSADWPAGAVWNFPNGRSGTLSLRLQLRPGFRGANIALTDHYSVPWDKEDLWYSLWNLPIDEKGFLLGKQKLAPNAWAVRSRAPTLADFDTCSTPMPQ